MRTLKVPYRRLNFEKHHNKFLMIASKGASTPAYFLNGRRQQNISCVLLYFLEGYFGCRYAATDCDNHHSQKVKNCQVIHVLKNKESPRRFHQLAKK